MEQAEVTQTPTKIDISVVAALRADY